MGHWEGLGAGEYPTIEPFAYHEVLEIGVSPKGFLTHSQRTVHAVDGLPLHAETGYWRVVAPGRIELVLAHPSGVVELCVGEVDGSTLHLRSTYVGCTPTAKGVETLERWYEVIGDRLRYRLSMGAIGVEHQHHLAGELHRTT